MATRLVPVDAFDMYCLGADADYVYGLKNGASNVLYRRGVDKVQTAGWNVSDANDATVSLGTVTMDGFLATSDGALLLSVTDTVSAKVFVYKSVDDGATFGANSPLFNDNEPVLRVGYDTGVHAANVGTIYGQTMFSGLVNGVQTVLVGWYSVVTAGYNLIKVMKSTDNGTTFTELFSTNLLARHCHIIKRDPYTGHIWFGFGDTSAHSGLFSWDGVSAFPVGNFDWAALDAANGFNVFRGNLAFRPLALMFDNDYVYFGSDNGVSANSGVKGIFRAKKTGAHHERLDSSIASITDTAHGFGLKHSSGTMIITDFPESASAPTQSAIWTSDDSNGYDTWQKSGVVHHLAAATFSGRHIRGMFEFDGKVYLSSSGKFAGQWTQATVVCDVVGNFVGAEPEPLYPVRWVGASGVDSTGNAANGLPYGSTPDYRWASVDYALEGSHITYGNRVIVGDGTYSASTLPVWTAYSLPAVAGQPVYVSGENGNKDLVILAGTGSYTFYTNTGDIPVVFQDITMKSGSAVTTIDGSSTSNSRVEFHRCDVGDLTTTIATNIANRGSEIIFVNSRVLAAAAVTQSILVKDTAINAGVKFISSVLQGGITGIYSEQLTTGYSADLLNSLVFGQVTYGLRGVNNRPFKVKNSIIYCPSITAAISHNAATTYAAADISNNSITGTKTNMAGTTTTDDISLGALPYTDATTGDFTVTNVAVLEKGNGYPRKTDITGGIFHNPPSVGVTEYGTTVAPTVTRAASGDRAAVTDRAA